LVARSETVGVRSPKDLDGSRSDRSGLVPLARHREVAVSRTTRILSFAAIALFATAPVASAIPAKKVDASLAALWTTVLETPSAQNSFGTGGPAFACFDLGRTVAPFAPVSVESCTVKPGTKVFIAARSVECSTFEGNGSTEAELRTCARESDVQVAPTVTVDGKRVWVAEVETPLLNIVLPADNIFGQPAGTRGLSVGHGWVALLHPLSPGTHTIVIDSTLTTTIVVKPRG
jgi:hypothetical protein